MLRYQDELSLSNLQREEILTDPYPFYEKLRSQDPVHWDAEMGFWVISRFSEVDALYTDDRFSRAEGLLRGFDRLTIDQQQLARPVYDLFSRTMFYADPPYHTHLRGLMNHAFTPRRVERLRPVVQKLVDDLLEPVTSQGRMDVIQQLAYPLPVMVIAELLGLPAADRERFKTWSDDLFAILGTVRSKSQVHLERAARSLEEMTDYVRGLSRERKKHPQDDLLSVLLVAVDQGVSGCPYPHHTGSRLSSGRQDSVTPTATMLTEEELVANITILLSTGHETTTHLIGNGLLALLQHPDQLQKVRNDPAMLEPAIEEILRYDSPVQITYRSALEDAQIEGKLIRKGDLVNTVIGSANRDPLRYRNPEVFDISRGEKRHLAFGMGIHFCIGASLVRLEAEVAFQTLLRLFPELHLTDDPLRWQEHPIFRGLKSLPVEF